jgi:hypothetical protein
MKGRRRKFTREEAVEALRHLYDIYGVAPAFLAHYTYLAELERSLNGARRLPSQSIINKYWPNVRDAWLSIGVEPDYDLDRLDTGFATGAKTDALIRAAYARHPTRQERLRELLTISTACRIPVPALALRAAQMGLENHTRIEWTDDELEILKSCAHLSKEQITLALAERGFRRSRQAGVIVRAKREERLSDRPGYYSMGQLGGLFDTDPHCVRHWLDEGWLPHVLKGTRRTRQQGGDTRLIRREDVAAFVRRYPELIDLRKVNQVWLVGLLNDPRPSARTEAEVQEHAGT